MSAAGAKGASGPTGATGASGPSGPTGPAATTTDNASRPGADRDFTTADPRTYKTGPGATARSAEGEPTRRDADEANFLEAPAEGGNPLLGARSTDVLSGAALQAARGAVGEETAKDPEGDVPTEDNVLKAGKPIGAQKEPAQFVASGSLPHAQVASPSGPVPVASVVNTHEEAQKIIDEQKDLRGKSTIFRPEKLDEQTLARMTGAEIRAVAFDRGYDMGQGGGTRVVRERFLVAQKEDKRLGGEQTQKKAE